MGVFEVAKHESVLKIWVAPFLWPLGPILARIQNTWSYGLDDLSIGCQHLHMEAALKREFLEPRNPPKSPYYSKAIFLGQFIEVVRFC